MFRMRGHTADLLAGAFDSLDLETDECGVWL